MFYATINGETFFTTNFDSDDYTLTSAKISKSANAADSFTFTIPPCNIAYDKMQPFTSYVDVFRGKERVFSGRVLTPKERFDGQLNVKCEGLFAVLNDSVIRPFTHENASVANLVSALITQHNSQVDDEKKIVAVNVTIDDKDFIAYRAYENYETTMERLLDLIDTFGGYMDVEKTDAGLVLNWMQNYTDSAMQSINFGENLLDLTMEEKSEDIITALIPLGAVLKESGDGKERLTIASVNGGSDIIYADEMSLKKYGKIVGTEKWDDVKTAAALLAKGREYLKNRCSGNMKISLKAVDLADAGYSVESFTVGQLIKVVSEPHGLKDTDNLWFACTSQSLDLLNPGSNKLTLGSTVNGYLRDAMKDANSAAREGRAYTDYVIGQSVGSISAELERLSSEYESAISQLPSEITATVIENVSNQYDTLITTLQSQLQLSSDQYNIWFGENGRVFTWFTFNDDGFTVRENGSSVYSVQDSESYRFLDASDNELLRLDADGLTASTANVTGQLKIMNGEIDQWAIRKGAHISSLGGVNLDDVWIGG